MTTEFTHPDSGSFMKSEIDAELARIDRVCTPEEIFVAGFKYGLSHAGLTEDGRLAFENWVLSRIDS